MSFSSTLLHARKSRANSEISELLTARRMDITVWMSSPNDEVPVVAEAGATRVARGSFSGRSRAASVAAWALVYPTSWRRSEAAAGGLRVRMTVGGRVYNWQRWHCPGPPFLCGASTRIPERPHTMFRLLNIFLASSVLGRTARTNHNSEPSLRQSLCTECTGSLAAEVGLDFVYRKSVDAADNGL
ncbi:hypothetical protein EVAR_19289_1 [Eumeta japonica]|uniref:Uncharacterized protein n=1 Tax=Eumeta variegata TaxID=151549 RepID=A0A4C1UEQ6_EUMVA|nr:hypothetical protein EVAR_19289_1 [Eumeta japonica]